MECFPRRSAMAAASTKGGEHEMPSFPFSRLPPLPELGTSPFSTCESIDGDTKESLAFPEQKIQEQRCKVGKFTEARRIGRGTPRTPKIVSRINRVDVSTATDAGPWNNWGHTTILARATSVGRWGSAGNELGAHSSNGMTVRTPPKRGGREDATGGSGTCETNLAVGDHPSATWNQMDHANNQQLSMIVM